MRGTIMSEPEYQPTEEDILAMLHKLRIESPEYATPSNALKLLNYQNDHLKMLEELYPEEIERILKDLEQH